MPLADGGGHLPIRTIGIGPGFEGAEVTNAVRSLARQHGYESVDIYLADTPYRRV